MKSPTAGTILVEGKDIMADRNQTRQLRERMGMVFQQFNLFPHLRVLDNITIAPMKVKKVPKQEIEAKALQLLDRVGLQGQGRRVAESALGRPEAARGDSARAGDGPGHDAV